MHSVTFSPMHIHIYIYMHICVHSSSRRWLVSSKNDCLWKLGVSRTKRKSKLCIPIASVIELKTNYLPNDAAFVRMYTCYSHRGPTWYRSSERIIIRHNDIRPNHRVPKSCNRHVNHVYCALNNFEHNRLEINRVTLKVLNNYILLYVNITWNTTRQLSVKSWAWMQFVLNITGAHILVLTISTPKYIFFQLNLAILLFHNIV